MNHNQPIDFKLNVVSLAVLLSLSTSVYAQTAQTTDDEPSVVLDKITVTAARKIGRKSTEVTGLGKIIKHTEDIDKEQIMGIRDLTRYDPGISVVEQGRGATSGYSIRGVDRNRVGLQVDGLVQTQSYITERSHGSEHSNANGGAINEIEYENVRSIELSKGSASAEFGSGALGGAVSFRTKEPKDIIKEGQNWGVNVKNAYSSKNKQFANTVGVAGRAGKFEGLVQFTHRKGEEIQVHKAAKDLPQTITRVGAYVTPYELRDAPWNNTGQAETLRTNGWFVLKEECPTLTNCVPKPQAEETRLVNARHDPRTTPAYTPKEQADYDSMVHSTETVNAEDYTGADRILPNPMDYQSKSWLLKGGYHFTDNHYMGVVIEDTKQEYDVQDKTKASYLTLKDLEDIKKGGSSAAGLYTGNNIHEGIVIPTLPFTKPLAYTRGAYYDEHHDKTRAGVAYKYTAPNKDGLVDRVDLTFDRQKIGLETFFHEHRCSNYPNFDKNCRASMDKPWSSYQSHRNKYQETHNVLQLSADKRFKIAGTDHRVNLLTGMDRFKSGLYRGDYFAEYNKSGWNQSGIGSRGTYNNPHIYERIPAEIETRNYCREKGIGLADCRTREITGHNHFIALRDHVKVGKYVDLGVGVRYDHHVFNSNDPLTSTGKYNNWSYNAGLTVNPTDNLAISYRHSNGFRVPAFYELFGRRGALDLSNEQAVKEQYVSKLSPEKAINHEFGVGLLGDFGYFEISHFRNKYKDLITTAQQEYDDKGTIRTKNDGYYNLQNITLTGINVLGKIDWYGVFDKLPDGLYSTLAYNKIKAKDAEVKSGFRYTNSPLLDTLQPSRYVAGIGYDSPNDRWGVNMTATYSKAKNTDELLGEQIAGRQSGIAATKIASKRWYTYDLTGYMNINKNFTLRAGVYNLLNRKYSTWESIRQSSVNSVNQDASTNPVRFAASGRNFNLALEMKF